MNKIKINTYLLLFLLIDILLIHTSAGSAIAASNFSVSTYAGIYNPHLDFLTDVLANNQVAILQDANFLLPRNEEFLTEKRNISIEKLQGKILYGVELEWKLSNKYSLFSTISAWEGTSVGKDTISMFTRSNLPATPVPRQAKYSLLVNDITMGWRFRFLQKKDVADLYLNLGLLGYSSINMKMDALIQVVTPAISFASMSSMEAKGDSIFMKVGLGGEYYVTKWWSVGGNANYLLSMLQKMKSTRSFLAGYPETPEAPPEADPPVKVPPPQVAPEFGDTIDVSTVVSEGVFERRIEDPVPLRLQMDGFEFQGFMRFHF